MAQTKTFTNLQIGSRGNDVSTLQQQLKTAGLYSGRIDGVYGPQTQQAIQKFQSGANISNDGIYGPITANALTQANQNPLSHVVNSEQFKQLTPETQQVVQSLSNEGGNRAAMVAGAFQLGQQGMPIGRNGQMTPQDWQTFYDMADQNLDKSLSEQIRFGKSDFDSELQRTKKDYELNLGQQKQDFGTDVEKTNVNEAQQGTLFSSGRQSRMRNLNDTYGRKMASLENNTGYQIGKIARNYEKNYGSDALGGYDFGLEKTGTSGTGQYTGGAVNQAYKPLGNMYGDVNTKYAQERARQALTRYNA